MKDLETEYNKNPDKFIAPCLTFFLHPEYCHLIYKKDLEFSELKTIWKKHHNLFPKKNNAAPYLVRKNKESLRKALNRIHFIFQNLERLSHFVDTWKHFATGMGFSKLQSKSSVIEGVRRKIQEASNSSSDLLRVKDLEKVLRLRMENDVLIDIFEVCPAFLEKNGTFLFAMNQTEIRKVFHLSERRLKNVEEAGFTKDSKKFYVIFSRTGRNKYHSSVLDECTFKKYYERQLDYFKNGKLCFKRINYYLGVDRDIYKKFIVTENLRLEERKKKPHKRHANAIIYLDKNGRETTVKEYAELNKISKQGAEKALKKIKLDREMEHRANENK